jgi:transcription termination factor Rho
MSVLERPELEASPLADLHAIANEIGLDGFRRLRKADLINAILGEPASAPADTDDEEEEGSAPVRRRRPARSRRAKSAADEDKAAAESEPEETDEEAPSAAPRRVRSERLGAAARSRRGARGDAGDDGAEDESPARAGSGRGDSARGDAGRGDSGRGESGRGERGRGGRERTPRDADARTAEGVVELLGNGSAFLRVDPPDPSDDDIYISAAQVRRCELVSGDRVSGPVRTPRRSERYPSLARVDTINGVPADSVAEGTRYEDLPVAYPSERFELDGKDATLKAIEWLTPIGKGSRAVIVGAARSGKTETLRLLSAALAGREGLEVSLVLAGARPEELAEWQAGPVAPAVTLSFAASADSQGQAVEHAVESAKRVAARGGDAVVLIDGLDGLHPHAARKVLASARNLTEGGSLTVIATAIRSFGGESTVIALDVALTSTGRLPALDLVSSGTVKPELLVGEDGAQAITKARAKALAG